MVRERGEIVVLMDIDKFDKRPLVVSMVGLCGSGKSTLAKKLSRKLNASVFTIGHFRDDVYDKCSKGAEYPKQAQIGEVSNRDKQLIELRAWLGFWEMLLDKLCLGQNVIIDTSGLNKRLTNWLEDISWNVAKVIKVKLVCPRSVLGIRLRSRKQKQKGFFPYDFDGHEGFNKELSKHLREERANITVDTGRLDKEETYKKVMKDLKRYGV